MRTRTLGYRETQVLAFAQAVIGEQGVAPSYGMICAELGIPDRCQVHRIVVRLESKGFLRRVGAGRVRRIQFLKPTIHDPALV